MSVEMSLSNLITKAARVVGQNYQRECAPLGITAPQAGVIWILAKVGTKTQVEIAQYLHLEKTNVNAMVKKLQTVNLVCVERLATDARKSHVSLTPQGMQLASQLGEVDRRVNKTYQDLIDNPQELEIVHSFLRKIVFGQ